MHTHIYTQIYTYIHTHRYTHTYTLTYTHTYTLTYTQTHTYIHTYVHTHIHTHKCAYIHKDAFALNDSSAQLSASRSVRSADQRLWFSRRLLASAASSQRGHHW